jgi:hypothetical protein
MTALHGKTCYTVASALGVTANFSAIDVHLLNQIYAGMELAADPV